MLRASQMPVLFALGWFVSALCLPLRADLAEQVRLDFFFSPGCSECERVKREVFPRLEERFADYYELVGHDMNQAETIPLLIAYQDRCGNHENGLVSIIVDHTVFLSGYETISATLLDRVNEALSRRQSSSWRPPEPPPRMTTAEQRNVVQTRASAMTILSLIHI